MTGFPMLARQRKFGSKILATAATFEIVGTIVVLALFPRWWPIGAILIAFAAMRVSILAERSRDAASGFWVAAFNALRVIALVLSAVALLAILAGLLRLVIGTSQGM